MLQQEQPGDCVLATGEAHSLRSFVEIVFSHAKLDMNQYVEIDQSLYRPYDKTTIVGDPTRVATGLGWKSKTTFRALAIEMYESALEDLKRTHEMNRVNL